jgi:hypothetical protein
MHKIILVLLVILVMFIISHNYDFFINTSNEEPYILPKNIYCFWHEDKNNIINSFINNWKKKISPEWTINFINVNNLGKYVSNEFLHKYNNIEIFRFSDFLRLELLKNYGGVWLDISSIIINRNFLDKYHQEMIDNKYDVCMYEFKCKTIINIEPYLENWFIMAPKNSKFIIDLYNEFEKGRLMDFIIYKNNILKPSGINLQHTITEDYYNTYLMQHAIINYLFKIGKKYKINIKDASESFFKLQNSLKWKNNDIINNIISNNNWSDYYAIKLSRTQRESIDNEVSFINKINNL